MANGEWKKNYQSVVTDPRIDPDDEHDQLMVFEVNKTKNRLDLKDKQYGVDQTDLKAVMSDQQEAIASTKHQIRTLNLDLRTAHYVRLVDAYRPYPHRMAPKYRGEVLRAEIPKESWAVGERSKLLRREHDSLRHRRQQLLERRSRLSDQLRRTEEELKEAESAKRRAEQRARVLVNSICKADSKLTTATVVRNTYQDLHVKLKKQVIEYPDRVKKIAEEHDSLETENNNNLAVLDSVKTYCRKTETRFVKMTEEMREVCASHRRWRRGVMEKIDPGEHPHLFAPTHPRMIAHRRAMAQMQMKATTIAISTDTSECSEVIARQEKLLGLIKTLAEHQRVALKLQLITKHDISTPKEIGLWLAKVRRKEMKMLEFSEYRFRQRSRKRKLLNDLKNNFGEERACASQSTVVERKIGAMRLNLNAAESRVAAKRKTTESRMRMSHDIEVECGRWLNKFLPFCSLAVQPQKNLQWIENAKQQGRASVDEVVELFLLTLHTICSVARSSIASLLQNAHANHELPQAVAAMNFADRRGFSAAVGKAKRKAEVGSGELKNHRQVDPAHWLSTISEEHQFNVMHQMFLIALERHHIQLSQSNNRVYGTGSNSNEDQDLEDLLTPDNRDFVSRDKVKRTSDIFELRKKMQDPQFRLKMMAEKQ